MVIHDWAEPQAPVILKNVPKSMKPHTRLMLIEQIVPTTSEYEELYSDAGFQLEEIVPTASPYSLIIGRPRD